jgi:CLIP-associating protein 1/2
MAVVGAGEVIERLLKAFGHKNWRLREQVTVCVQRALSGPQERAVPLGDMVPLVAKLLNDQQPAVRTAAMDALVEVYRIVGHKLKRDLEEKHKIRTFSSQSFC